MAAITLTPFTLTPATGLQYIDAVEPITGTVGGEITSVFYGTIAQTGDQWESDLVTSQGNPIQQNADGTFVIIGGGEVPETFSVRLWDQTDETWSTKELQSINISIPPIGSGAVYKLKLNINLSIG